MNEPMSLLVIVVPESLEDPLIDELLLHPEWVSGFDTQAVEGHGSGMARKSGAERVRGRARRVRAPWSASGGIWACSGVLWRSLRSVGEQLSWRPWRVSLPAG